MSRPKVWFITGAAKGMGKSFVGAALARGHMVVATGRRPDDRHPDPPTNNPG